MSAKSREMRVCKCGAYFLDESGWFMDGDNPWDVIQAAVDQCRQDQDPSLLSLICVGEVDEDPCDTYLRSTNYGDEDFAKAWQREYMTPLTALELEDYLRSCHADSDWNGKVYVGDGADDALQKIIAGGKVTFDAVLTWAHEYIELDPPTSCEGRRINMIVYREGEWLWGVTPEPDPNDWPQIGYTRDFTWECKWGSRVMRADSLRLAMRIVERWVDRKAAETTATAALTRVVGAALGDIEAMTDEELRQEAEERGEDIADVAEQVRGVMRMAAEAASKEENQA